MFNKNYIVLIISQEAARMKKLILSPLFLKVAAAVLSIVIVISIYFIHNYFSVRKKLAELQNLRAEANLQREEIQNFMLKINILEAQLAKLKEMEKQVEKDLQELKELKTKNASKRPTKNVKKKNQLIGQEEKKEKIIVQDWPETRYLRTEKKASLIEMERNNLVRQLHQDLYALQKEFYVQESNLRSLQKFLQNQKSILLATPTLWPVVGAITSSFGETRLSLASGGDRPHRGVDISAPLGTPVISPAEGTVSAMGWASELGRYIYLDHGHGFSTLYGHLKDIKVKVGQKVKKGEIIGTVGMSGNSTGPHLHYEVHVRGIPVNPLPYLRHTS